MNSQSRIQHRNGIHKNGTDAILAGTYVAEVKKGECRFETPCSVLYIVGNRIKLRIGFVVPSDKLLEFNFAIQSEFLINPNISVTLPGRKPVIGPVELNEDVALMSTSYNEIEDEAGLHASLHYATFQLINFRFVGVGTQPIKRYSLSVDGWKIDVTNTDSDMLERFRELNEGNGYGITHEVKVSRKDGETFGPAEISKFTEVLSSALSFANGGFVSLLGLKGFGLDDEPVYHRFGYTMAESWQERINWLDRFDVKWLESYLQCFLKTHNEDPSFYEVVRKTIYWYTRSNRSGSGMDSGIILSCSALEKFSNYIIEKNDFKDQTSGNPARFSTAAKLLGVDVRLCEERDSLLLSMRKMGEEFDISHVIPRVRNNLVHKKADSGKMELNQSIQPTWNVSQWLIEEMILRHIGYNGEKRNRRNLI